MKKRLLSILTALALCLTLLPATALAGDEDVHPAPGTSTTQLDPAPTTLADEPFPTLQSFVHFKYYPDHSPIVGNALKGATTGDGSHGFAWDANQNGNYGEITLNSDGTYSYRLDNDDPTVYTLQFGQTLTERFTYTYTDKNGKTDNGAVNIYIPGNGHKGSEPKPVVAYPTIDVDLNTDSTDPVSGNVFESFEINHNDSNFAWEDDQKAAFGTVSLESDGNFSYVLNNNHPYVKALQPGETLIEEFRFKCSNDPNIPTEQGGDVVLVSLNIIIRAGGGSTGDEPQPGDPDKHHDNWTKLTPSSDILIGNSYYLSDDVAYTGTGPIRVFNNVTLCLNGHTLDLNGKYIYLYNGASLTLCDCSDEETENIGSITGGSATDGAVFVDNGGTFNMTGGNIINANKRGVYVKGAFNMEGGTISGSSATYSGGVYVNGGTFDMEGGSIINSKADVGGGVCVTGDGKFTMSGGSITGNTADYGSGVCVNSGTFDMEGGEITDNTADYGGGVYIPNTGSFTMSGAASITNNTADKNGGGVYVNGGTFNMERGAITDNTADYGGGVFAGGKFSMEDGEINGNHADYGDGVYVFDDTFTLTGGTPSDVYLYNGQTIAIGDALNHAQKIGVTMRTPGVFTSGWSTHMGSATPTDYFISGSPAYTIVLAGNEAALERLNAVTFLPNGGNGTMETQYFSNGEVKALTANAFVCPGYTFTGWNTQADGSGTSYGNGEEITLTNDLTLYAQWTAIPSDGGSSAPTYSVSLPDKVTGGEISVKKYYAQEGETFRFALTPDEGYELAALSATDSRGRELDLTDEGGGEYSFEMPASRVEIEVSFRKIAVELPFTDVPESTWYADGVRYVYENGLMSGVSATSFGPDVTTSRAMIATILWRMAGSPVVNYAMDYTDVAQGQWYSEAIRWAASEGIVGGYGNGLFGTNDPITREQFAVMLYRFAQEQGYDVSIGENTNILSYTDVADLSEYAISAMQWACGAGIIEGVTESTLVPQGNSTRAQVATMLMRFCEEYGIG